jgi:outer membrane protein
MGSLRSTWVWVAAVTLALPATLAAQGMKIAVADMEKAIVQSVDGQKAETTFTKRLEELRKNIEGKQKAIEDAQNKLKTQDRVLDDTVRAERNRDIERQQTELTRLQEDAQRELETLRTDLMRPIAEVADRVLRAYGDEQGLDFILDRSNPQNDSIIYVHPQSDITETITKRIDAELAKAAPKKP